MSDTAEFWHQRCGELLCLIEDLKEFDADAFDAPDNEKIEAIDKLWKDGVADPWQPIETAPKDWTNIILFDDERDPSVFEGYFSMEDGGRNCWMENQGMGSEPVNPTRWMPLDATTCRTHPKHKWSPPRCAGEGDTGWVRQPSPDTSSLPAIGRMT